MTKAFKRDFNFKSLDLRETKELLTSELGWTIIRGQSRANGIKSVDPRITHACDHECPHCWANLYGKHMSLEAFKQILSLADRVGITAIQFTGGEPTLNKDMPEMARIAKKRVFT